MPVAFTAAGRWEYRLPTLDATRYSLRMTATDKAGNIGRATSIFTVAAPTATPTPRPTPTVTRATAPSVILR